VRRGASALVLLADAHGQYRGVEQREDDRDLNPLGECSHLISSHALKMPPWGRREDLPDLPGG
jgi:hypothetical protein